MGGTHGDITQFYLKFRKLSRTILMIKAPTKIKTKTYSGLIAGSNDWKLLVDLWDSNYVFPPEVLATLQWPDYCNLVRKTLKDLLIELTCSSEENIVAAQLQKENRYLQLTDQITGPLYYLHLKLVYEGLSLIHWNIHFFNLVFLDTSSQKNAKLYP